MKELAEDYLEVLLDERYHDGVDRREQRVFNGEDIKEAFLDGAKAATLVLAKETSLIDDDEEEEIIGLN